MATAALISPNTPYYPHHSPSPYSSGGYYQQQGPQQEQQQDASQNRGPGNGHAHIHSHSHGHGHGHGHVQISPSSTAAGMISPVDSRRTSDDHDMSGHRQSLPSLKEIIGKTTSSSYHHPSSAPPSGPQHGLPSPFSTTAPPRPFPAESPSDMQHSPRSLHHPASIPPPPSSMYNQRPEPTTTFPAPPRPPLPGRAHGTPPPNAESHQGGQPPSSVQSLINPQHPAQHVPHYPHSSQQQRHPQDQPPSQLQSYHHQGPAPRDARSAHGDSPPSYHAYPNAPAQQPPYPSHAASQHPLPPPPPTQGHMSSSHSASPHHSGPPSLPSPFESHQQTLMHEPPVDLNRSRTRYDQAVSRHFESWSYTEYLARIGSNSRTIYNFAEAFGSIAREEHGPHPMPGRMPSDREVCEMISNAEWLKTMLESLRHMVQNTVSEGNSGPGSGNASGPSSGSSGRQKPANLDDADMPMYSEPGQKPYGMEVKKRRGRAAPPGRCHSCNRIDTPEWRRGPDGARTLCNACGLHYAKLERKKQLESRQIRPKHPDDRR
ncbi:uncharacterized protein SPSK_05129 [Sporothrix schenckii 1099-18]|uniref:GATA-type domain-containing protein n=1 Tax=Sporothrix schenckii 1099-18 TaxID=1397361 RepID=A0A0F2LZ39_SPOSC|nr:uncharacterized protein SPSK_05129 [Sporothrix schenckii 1099-18]KJR81156.1 hypothetical protein SPSK_05129 [Sporothrix schenckii 1099-18]